MGEQRVSIVEDRAQMNKFVRSLLNDVTALEHMLENEWFDVEQMHIGAEQEMVIVDKKTYKPACVAMDAMELMKEHEWLETELASFNLEICLTPQPFKGDCLSMMHEEIASRLGIISKNLDTLHSDLLLTGILPTLSKHHLVMDNLTPKKRYKALMEAMNRQLIGSSFELRLVGIDELRLKHDSPMLEACNTSFQVHLQVEPSNFVKMYNISQAITGPVMAIAANSPMVFGKRLWHESRIAMFQQSIDTRTSHQHLRERSPRVSFGRDWLHESILEIYKEDISRFRVLLSSDVEEESLEMIKQNKTPKLRALQVHNSTVYRWNRPCYGISPNGKPHLRIENRVLPSGPTVIDEMANATFWLGLMIGLGNEVEDIKDHLSFDDVRDNFEKAAKFGIDTEFNWFNDEKISACRLVKEKLIPICRAGLESKNVKGEDIDKYLSVIEARADKHMNGARWLLRSYTSLKKEKTQDEALSMLTHTIMETQKKGIPVHEWGEPDFDVDLYQPTDLKVTDFMKTDLHTVQKDDIIDLVAEMMDWQKVRYTPVEDIKGRLVGLVTDRQIIRHFIVNKNNPNNEFSSVEDIMIKNPVSISSDKSIIDVMNLMRDKGVGCLPVIQDEELVGLITEADFMGITGRLFEKMVKNK